jgi:hypothetical protein
VEQGRGKVFESSYVCDDAPAFAVLLRKLWREERLRRGRPAFIKGKMGDSGQTDLDETEKALSR